MVCSPEKRNRRLLVAGLTVALVSVLVPGVAAAAPPSPLTPGSPNAGAIASLFWIIFWIAVVVFVLVEGLLIYAFFRFKRAPETGEDDVPQIHGNTTLELLWTVVPALIVVVMFVFSWQTLAQISTIPASPVALASAAGTAPVCYTSNLSIADIEALEGPNIITVEVVGHQYWWEFRYPQFNIVTASELYVPVGRVVRLQITSNDVVHSWWVPQLGGKYDATPGNVETTWYQATRAGIFPGQCAEFCGDSHPYMPGWVRAVSEDEFLRWVQARQVPAQPAAGLAAQKGEQLFAAKGCAGCHAVAGTNYQGITGPNMTHMGSRAFIGGVLENNPENMAAWLANSDQFKPGNLMAKVIRPGSLTPDEIEALVVYIEGLK